MKYTGSKARISKEITGIFNKIIIENLGDPEKDLKEYNVKLLEQQAKLDEKQINLILLNNELQVLNEELNKLNKLLNYSFYFSQPLV